MIDELDPRVEDDLAALTARDAERLRPALRWLLGGHGLDRLHQTGLQQFLWYELPFKWLGPVDDHHAVVAALARFFDQAGLARYAELARALTTAALLDPWATDPSAAFDAFHAAHVATGVVPPDTDGLRWGDVMGPLELDAFWSTAQALELAVAGGALTPGARGRRAEQARLTDEHLDRARPDQFGESRRQAITAERLVAWLDDAMGRGTGDTLDARAALLAPIANQLLREPEVPREAGRVTRPVVWLLEQAARPIRLTPAGRLPAGVVRDAADELGWASSSRFREADVAPLVELRGAAQRLGLLAARGGRLGLTRRGHDLLEGPRAAATRRIWSALVADQGSRSGLAGELEELVDAVLLDHARARAGARPRGVPIVQLLAVVRVPLTERGFGSGPPGRPVADRDLRPALDATLDRRTALGLVVTRRGHPVDPVRLTRAGEAFAVAALRLRATGAIPSPR